MSDLLRVPTRLGVAKTCLAIDAEAPLVKLALVREGCSVTKASRASLHLDSLAIFIRRESHLCWQFHNLSLAKTKLSHACLTPGVHAATLHDSERVKRACCDILHVQDTVLVVEELNKAWRGGNLDVVAQTELAFIAASPRVKIASIGHNHRVAVAARDHRDTLISQWLQDLRLVGWAGATVAAHALVATAHAEDVAITRQI